MTTSNRPSSTPTRPSSEVETLATRATGHLLTVIDQLSPADLDRPSPCPGWRVRDVLAHLTGTADALVDLVRVGERDLPDQLATLADPIADARAAIIRLREALGVPPVDPTWTIRAAGDAAVECTVHAWDLDPSRPLPDDLATDVLDFVAPLVDDTVRAQFFGPEVATTPGAPASERLVAFLGRPAG